MSRPFKRDEPFYIGQLNIFDYQRTGFKRWGTFLAQLPEPKVRAVESFKQPAPVIFEVTQMLSVEVEPAKPVKPVKRDPWFKRAVDVAGAVFRALNGSAFPSLIKEGGPSNG